MKAKITLILFLIIIFLLISNVEARSGCCSHHGGVCGCRCCDGTSLSSTCAPYYPSCGSESSDYDCDIIDSILVCNEGGPCFENSNCFEGLQCVDYRCRSTSNEETTPSNEETGDGNQITGNVIGISDEGNDEQNQEPANPCGNGIIDPGETCSNCPEDVKCDSGQYCSNDKCIDKCGDGTCEYNECSDCAKDCTPSHCQGNDYCDHQIGENCQNSPVDCKCPKNKICDLSKVTRDAKGCYELKCGNRYLDPGENEQTCCRDAGCTPPKKCNWQQNRCVDCASDSDCSWGRCSPKSGTCVRCIEDGDCETGRCNTIINECVECVNDEDCDKIYLWKNDFYCSPDFKKVIQSGEYITGTCDISTHKCVGKRSETTRDFTDCTKDNKYCQDGHCGCSEGYAVCEPLQNCVKNAAVNENEACSCDFQCKSGGFCYHDKCFEPINAELSLTKSNIKELEETILTLGINNKLNKDMLTKFTINKGSGASFTSSSLGADICSGNQCTASTTVAAKSAKEITVNLMGESSGETPLYATITYEFDDKPYSFKKELKLIIKECGNNKCEEGETQRNCCVDCGTPNSTKFYNYNCNNVNESYDKDFNFGNFLIFILEIIGIGIIFYFSARFGFPVAKKHIKKYKKKKLQERKEKELLIKEREKKGLCIKCGKKLIEIKGHKHCPKCDEYCDYCGRDLDKKSHEMIKFGKKSDLCKKCFNKWKKQKEKSGKDKCSGCSAVLREGIKFCTKCGKEVKEKITFDEDGNIREFKELKRREKEAKKEWPTCPRCGAHLILRTGKYGKFYGCSNYPHCRYTKKYRRR